MTAEALTACPKDQCRQKKWGRGRVKKQVTAGAGLLFKGTGFYITDYRSEGYKAAAKKDAGGGGSGAAETKSSGDSKPAAKTEAKADKPAKSASTTPPPKAKS